MPRTLLHEVVQKKTARDEDPAREVTVKLPVDLWEKVRDSRVVLLEGPAGMGKSTLTKHVVRESYAQRWLPIWIPFRTFVDSRLSIRDYLDQVYVPWLGLSDERVASTATEQGPDRSLGQWLYDAWRANGALLILDGLDEVFVHEERVAALRGLPAGDTAQTRPATILTSRPLSQGLPFQIATVELQGLTPHEQDRLLDRYRRGLHLTESHIHAFRQELQQSTQGRIHALLTRPGHLIQILTVYAQTGVLPTTETEVLDQLIQGRLTITGRIQPPVEPDEPSRKRKVLESLALHHVACRQGQRQTRAQWLALVQQVLLEWRRHHTPLFPLSQASALLNDLTRNSGLLKENEDEPEVYEFETVIWEQFLTGSALAQEQTYRTLDLTEAQVLEFLDKKAWDPEWETVIRSWVGNTGNPLPFLDRLSDVQKDDLARHRLGVAGRCLTEIPQSLRTQPAYQSLALQIPTEAFAVWQAEAERETEELVITSLRMSWIEMERSQAKLMQLLTHENKTLRIKVTMALGDLGLAMPKLVQNVLLELLEDEDWRMRIEAVAAFGKLGVAISVAAQQALVERSRDENPRVCTAAARALEGLGTEMLTTVQQALLDQFRDKEQNWYVRGAAAEALSGLGTAMPVPVQEALVEGILEEDPLVHRTAEIEIRKLGMAMPVPMQQALVERLRDVGENWLVRARVAKVLGELGTAMPVAVQQALMDGMWDEDQVVCVAAAEALGELGTAMPVAVQQALIDGMHHVDQVVCVAAAKAFGGLGGAMPLPAQEALVVWLQDNDSQMRRAAAVALGELGAAMSRPIQQAMMDCLWDENDDVRDKAAEALGRLGAAMPAAAQQALVERLQDEEWVVRRSAACALGRSRVIISDQAQDALLDRMRDRGEEGRVRRAAARALGELGTVMPVPVQQALVALLQDEDWEMRRVSAEVLRWLGTAMPVLVQKVFVARLENEDNSVRREAAEALGKLGSAMTVLVQQALMVRLTDADLGVRKEAIRALGQPEAAMPESVSRHLVACLSDEDGDVRRMTAAALTALQRIGHRLFVTYGSRNVRRVSNLSATAPFPDCCQQGSGDRVVSLVPLFHWRIPLTLS